jgi:hypothetical protein
VERTLDEKFTDAEFEEIYQEFIDNKSSIHNTRVRPDNESLWDTLASAQDDFFKSPEGAVIDSLVKDTLKPILEN